MNFESLLERLIADPTQIRASVESLRSANPTLTVFELAEKAVRSAKIRAAAAGAATGAATSPITMIPAALADIAAVLRIEAALVAEIGALLNPDSLNDPNVIKADVVSVIFPAAASQALRQLGIRASEKLTQAALRKYATEDFIRTITRFAARYLGKELTRETILAKSVPIIGIGIGAGWNWLEVRAIGNRAIRYYSGEPIGTFLAGTSLPSPKELISKAKRYLPTRRRKENADE